MYNVTTKHKEESPMADHTLIHKRFKTMVNVLYVLSYIPLAFVALGILVLLGSIIAVPFIPFAAIENRLTDLPVTGTYETTGLTLEVTDAYLETIALDQTAILLTLAAFLLYLAAVAVILFSVNRWLYNLKRGNIFTIRNSRFIEIAAYTVIILTVIDALADLAVGYLMMQTFSLAEISSELNEQLIFGVDQLSIEFNLMLLFSGIIIWILAKVFKYGAFLQEEYDATV